MTEKDLTGGPILKDGTIDRRPENVEVHLDLLHTVQGLTLLMCKIVSRKVKIFYVEV